jgi:hypothetical protein
LPDHLVTHPETEAPGQQRQQHANKEEPDARQHHLAVSPRAGDARRAVVEGDKHADVGYQVSVSIIDSRRDGPEKDSEQAQRCEDQRSDHRRLELALNLPEGPGKYFVAAME